MASTATITLLFCDLVDSTEIYTRHGDAATDASRRAFFVALRSAVVGTGGTEVKNTGDGLMVVFPNSAAEAVRCAIAMQQAMTPVRSPSDEPLQLRVGISTGEVTHDDNDWFGTPVNEAARLCGAAAPGTILVSDVVRSLVAPRGEHQFSTPTPFALKGLGREVRAASVDWQDAETIELGSASISGGQQERGAQPAPATRTARSRKALIIAAVLVVVVAIAATTWARDRNSNDTASVAAISRPQGYVPELVDEPCADEIVAADISATCSTLTVPEDRAAPDERQVDLQVVRLPARGDTSGARDMVAIAQDRPLTQFIADPLRTSRNIVVLVRRGFGGTPTLTCPELGGLLRARLAFSVRSIEYSAPVAEASELCRKRWVDEGVDLDAYADAESATDFRDLVFALGGDAVDLRVDGEAASLGLRIVSESAPSVHAVLVGSPIEPGGNRFLGRIPDTARALDLIDEMCTKDPECVARFGDLAAQRSAWIADRDAEPMLLEVTSADNSTIMVRVDGDTLVVTSSEALVEGSSNVALIPQIVAARSESVVATFHAASLEAASDPDWPWIAFGAVWCLDQHSSRMAAGLGSDATGNPALAALNTDAHVVVQTCKQGWGTSRLPFPPPTRAVPTLILAGDLDPVASPRRANITAEAFGERSTVVMFPTLSSRITNPPLAHPCIADLEAEFLANPDAELQPQACVDQIPPPQWLPG